MADRRTKAAVIDWNAARTTPRWLWAVLVLDDDDAIGGFLRGMHGQAATVLGDRHQASAAPGRVGPDRTVSLLTFDVLAALDVTLCQSADGNVPGV
jgi:hypothetical protein